MTTERRTDERTGYPPPALTAAVLALLAVVLAVVGISALVDTSARAFATYTPLEASVVDEHDEQLIVADRRGSRTETVRVVTVELPDGGRADLRSADLGVGTTATVYASSTGAVFEAPPGPPSLLEWMAGVAAVAAGVVLGVLSMRVVLRVRRS